VGDGDEGATQDMGRDTAWDKLLVNGEGDGGQECHMTRHERMDKRGKVSDGLLSGMWSCVR
jgi:hypothetical protein